MKSHFLKPKEFLMLKEKLKTRKLLQFPGAFIPLLAKEIERQKFDGVYISGGAFAASLGLTDTGITTLKDISRIAAQTRNATSLPIIVDADTGFEDVKACVESLEKAGVSALHLEDQIEKKRCGHLDGKTLVSCDEMSKRVQEAVRARSSDEFLIIARTDARGTDSLEEAISRAKAYVDVGADVIFPEALRDEKEFEVFRKEISVPLLANMTEFGKSKLLSKQELEDLGYNIVIYPVTTLRLAMKAVVEGLAEIKDKGTQEEILEKMQTRAELYNLLGYEPESS